MFCCVRCRRSAFIVVHISDLCCLICYSHSKLLLVRTGAFLHLFDSMYWCRLHLLDAMLLKVDMRSYFYINIVC